jgi:tRNA-guanine family transglycosylase
MRIETPRLWFTQCVKCTPRPWNFFKIDGLMLNAYDIISNKLIEKQIRIHGIHEYMKFYGLIAMDSGGFLFMKKRDMTITPEDLMSLYEEGRANFGVILDYPITPNLPLEVVKRRLLQTLENTERMLKIKQSINLELIPVIHGHDLKVVRHYIDMLEKIGDFNIYGIGSLVPSVFNTKGVGGIYNVIKIVLFVRTLLPDKILHVFGVGSSITMHLMYYIGVDSIDTTSWRVKAAFGAIQLPGVGDRYITDRERHKSYPALSREEQKILEECKCPVCKKEGLEGLKRSFTLRALHNAWVLQQEVEKTRKLIRSNEYGEYVREIIKKNKIFSKALEFADKLMRNSNTVYYHRP